MIDVTSSPHNAVANWVDDANPGTNNETAFESAIDAANASGDEIYFPPGMYWLNKPIYRTGLQNLRFYGTGAIIVCRGAIEQAGKNGKGGGFTLEGDNLTIDGLSFQGWVGTRGTVSSYAYGRLVRLTGNYNTVQNCTFKDGDGGAIEITGDYNIITKNFFNRCNNYPVANADYGAIQVTGSSKYNTISENKIIEQFYSGISAYGSGVTYLDIINNYIRSDSSSSSINHSMGIFLLQGANRDIKIIGNTIEKVDAEAIIIHSIGAAPSLKCLISNNIIRDCDYVSISLEGAANDSNATFEDYTIIGNIIENTSNAPNYDHHMLLDKVRDSIISNNKCLGYNKTGAGITFMNQCPRNQVSGNQFRTLRLGIFFASPDGTLKDNHIYDSLEGISLAYCQGSSVAGNMIKSCTTGVKYGTSSSPLHILNNAIVDCTNRYSGTVAPQVLTFSGLAGSGAYSSFLKTGTLNNGTATITFYHVYSGDRFLVLPANQSGSGSGAMYISLIDVNNSRVTVKSTDSGDNRDFMIIKMVSAG